MRYCAISSGSKGNCHLIQSGKQTVLIDAGGTAKQLACRLASLDVLLADADAVLRKHRNNGHEVERAFRVFDDEQHRQ